MREIQRASWCCVGSRSKTEVEVEPCCSWCVGFAVLVLELVRGLELVVRAVVRWFDFEELVEPLARLVVSWFVTILVQVCPLRRNLSTNFFFGEMPDFGALSGFGNSSCLGTAS
ncbi:hypothetical protein Droror1_Dr00025289 [Drosera rotundifolia]